MSDDLDDVLEELTGANDAWDDNDALDGGFEHKTLNDNMEYLHNSPIELTKRQLAGRAGKQIKLRQARENIYSLLQKGDKFKFKDNIIIKGKKYFYNGRIATFDCIKNSYVNFIYDDDPVCKNGSIKLHTLNVVWFSQYMEKL